MSGGDATDLLLDLTAGRRTAGAVVREHLDRIARVDPRLGAVADAAADRARARADELDRERARGVPPGPLFGLPFLHKANLCRAGHPTTCGSAILRGWTPTYDATAVERLVAAGAVPLGSARMDELGMGSTGETGVDGPTRNPWSPDRVPGGSSSGSAAAVAAGLAAFALGSDTGGSTRQPAALCGVTGFRPTWGRVSRHGLVAFASSLDQVGPIARSARDVELVLGVVSGADARDARCLPIAPFQAERADEPGLTGLRVGVVRAWLDDADPRVAAAVRAAVDGLAALGARPRDVELPHAAPALAVYHVVASCEAAANLARLDGLRYGRRASGDGTLAGTVSASRREGLGPEVRRRVLLGTFASSEGARSDWLDRAARVRRRVLEDFRRVFDSVDVVVGPTAPAPAGPLGRGPDPVERYADDRFTVPASLAGLPAASVPCGFVDDGGPSLPVGLQLVGPALADGTVLRVARAWQAATDWHARRPPEPPEDAP